MTSMYKGLSSVQKFDLFEDRVYERVGMPPVRAEIRENISGLTTDLHMLDVQPSDFRQEVWESSSDNIRKALLINRLVYWGLRANHPLSIFVPRGGQEGLSEFCINYSLVDFAADTLVAVNSEHVTANGKAVPSRMLKPTMAIYDLSSNEKRPALEASVIPMIFSDQHTDSEDANIPHPAHFVITNFNYPDQLRKALIEVAALDCQSTDYKPWVWQSRLEATLEGLASSEIDPLRFEARRRLNLPVDDVSYAQFQTAATEIVASVLVGIDSDYDVSMSMAHKEDERRRAAAQNLIKAALTNYFTQND